MLARFYVYILANRPRGVLYVGVTSDLPRRLAFGITGKTSSRLHQELWSTNLVYCEEYASVLEARARERTLKRWRREWKITLVEKLDPVADLADQFAL